ncbi:hypothetical protein [Streptomyces sp. CA-256286]|uniref:hypothetical protein n=1 Tax=Streptomyces sp. CA-256286 TaxID=2801033 RepID=UPI001A989DDC|nr:hypothetical protein [Streptomyces sp. CA-256286]QTA37032.1 hypothetical protein JHY03_72480 [Streptomyces sp. CA-256286]QTA37088.1 hypothetical protein JHY03_73040 [Streptomyces sp. CA-256286]
MSTHAPHSGDRELRVTVTDDVYEQLQVLAADKDVPAEEYAARMLTDDVTRARFLSGAEQFVTEHASGFAAHFGPGPRPTAGDRAA